MTRLTEKTRAVMGVLFLTWTKERTLGSCPRLAQTYRTRDTEKVKPLSDPTVEHATRMGIIHAIDPMVRCPKV